METTPEFKKYKHTESGEIVLLQIHRKQKSKYASLQNHILETDLNKMPKKWFYSSDFQLKRQYELLTT
tara:strand:+ start:46 stop:249 length:204 start_codon:yes stop_codon:yes gene_type:complete